MYINSCHIDFVLFSIFLVIICLTSDLLCFTLSCSPVDFLTFAWTSRICWHFFCRACLVVMNGFSLSLLWKLFLSRPQQTVLWIWSRMAVAVLQGLKFIHSKLSCRHFILWCDIFLAFPPLSSLFYLFSALTIIRCGEVLFCLLFF